MPRLSDDISRPPARPAPIDLTLPEGELAFSDDTEEKKRSIVVTGQDVAAYRTALNACGKQGWRLVTMERKEAVAGNEYELLVACPPKKSSNGGGKQSSGRTRGNRVSPS